MALGFVKWVEMFRRRVLPGRDLNAANRHFMVGRAEMWRMKRAFQERFLRERGIQPHHWLLDLGCGTLRGGIPLIQLLEPGHYYGVESRANVLEEGRRELRDCALEQKEPVLIACADISTLELDRHFDIIWAFSVLFHMTDDIMSDALHFVRAHLAADGVFYANLNLGQQEAGTWGEFPVMFRTWEVVQEMSHRAGLAVADLGTLEQLGHVSGDADGDAQHMLEFRG